MSKVAMQKALEALVNAQDLIGDWGSYASEYAQNKYDLKGDIENLGNEIKALEVAIAESEEPV